MHILLVADGRSPIARRWLDSLLALNYRVTLISSYPCDPPKGIDRLYIIPLAFSHVTASPASAPSGPVRPNFRRRLIKTFRNPLLRIRYLLAPLTVKHYAPQYQKLVASIKPDLVHALRIPFEGMLANYTPAEIPLAVSIWGNDLTLHAPRSRTMSRLTRAVLQRADGLHTDAKRDLRLATEWGFPVSRPGLVAPSNGGIDLERVQRLRAPLPLDLEIKIPKDHTLVINPRGVRSYTRTDTYFQAIPLVLAQRPKTAFLCPSMAGETLAERWASTVHADGRTILFPPLSQGQLWELFNRSLISVSVTNHDGTPNTLLEAMSCGSFPVAGNIESLREWIHPGTNGLLVDPGSPQELADAIIQALDDKALRQQASRYNLEMVQERAEVSHVRPKIAAFYDQVISAGMQRKSGIG